MTWINGQFQAPLPVSDRGLAYGDGIFETLACINQKLHLWSRHWQRLQQGAKQLALEVPEQQTLLNWIEQALAEKNNPSLAVVKIIITRGSGGRGYISPEQPQSRTIITIHPWPEHNDNDYQQGISALVCRTCLALQPSLAGIKHLNRLEQVLAAQELSANNCREGLMLECKFAENDKPAKKIVTEGISSNLFFVSRGQLFTPEIIYSGVSGTIRSELLERAKALGIPLATGRYEMQEVLNADEVFFTNSIFGILPVSKIIYQQGQKSRLYQQRDISMQLAKSLNPELQRPCQFITL